MIEKRTCNNPRCRDKGRVFSETRFLSGISPECPACHKPLKRIHSTIGRSKGGSGKRGGKG